MIRLIEVLCDQFRRRKKIYISWDAVSWHMSRKLLKRIAEHNAAAGCGGPRIVRAPLPARAQFLNVIESIFSGMARAIIHNSDYKCVDDAKLAIDRYFSQRNRYFRTLPSGQETRSGVESLHRASFRIQIIAKTPIGHGRSAGVRPPQRFAALARCAWAVHAALGRSLKRGRSLRVVENSRRGRVPRQGAFSPSTKYVESGENGSTWAARRL
jgi:hypothetical protein